MPAELRRADPADAATVARHRYPGESGDHLAVYVTWLPQVMAEGRYLGWLAPCRRVGSSAERACY